MRHGMKRREAGSKWFGYGTFWTNRLGAPVEELGVEADVIATGAAELVTFVTRRPT